MTSEPPPPSSRRRFLIALCIVGFAVVDFLLPLFPREARNQTISGVFIGIVGAQAGLLTIWAALGPQRWTWQLPLTFGCLVFLYTMHFMGFLAAFGPVHVTLHLEFGVGYLLLPLLFFALLLPLWGLRLATGWRIVEEGRENESSSTGSRQFHLYDLLVSTTMIAVALGLASMAMGGDERISTANWGASLLGCLFCTTWSAFSILPCLWAALIAKSWRTSAVMIIVSVLVMTAICSEVLALLNGTTITIDAVLSFVLPIHATLVGVMLAVLHVVRRWGYVLGRVSPGKAAVR